MASGLYIGPRFRPVGHLRLCRNCRKMPRALQIQQERRERSQVEASIASQRSRCLTYHLVAHYIQHLLAFRSALTRFPAVFAKPRARRLTQQHKPKIPESVMSTPEFIQSYPEISGQTQQTGGARLSFKRNVKKRESTRFLKVKAS